MSRKSANGLSGDIVTHTVKRAKRSMRWRNRLSGAPFRSRRF